MKSLTYKDFGGLFGATEEEVNSFCGELIDKNEFNYRELSLEERDSLLLKIMGTIYNDDLKSAGENRKNDWESGWGENLNDFTASSYDIGKLIPKYYKNKVPCRLNQDFIMPVSDNFVYNVTDVFRNLIFRKYLSNYENIYEFGCGTAHNLVLLSSLYPDKNLFGYDWSKPTLDIIDILRGKLKLNISGGLFDFFNPPNDVNIEKHSAVFTFGALEQTGADHTKFVNFLLEQKPELVINIECLNELYDESILTDYLALKYHLKRNYLHNFISTLKNLESEGKIKIDNIYRQKFGNIYNDTHSYVIWKPVF